MFDVIQMTNPYDQPYSITESYLNNGIDPTEHLYTEAVFVNGRQTMEPMVETMRQIKAELELRTKTQEVTARSNQGYNSIQKFDPKAFWRHRLFKQLEDQFKEAFGFRSVIIAPLPEKYNHNSNDFETKALGAWVYSINRYPIEGLVTDKGFKDKSNSLYLEMYMTLGIIKELEAEEIIAVILHEVGHSIDPALVDIKYIETNILSKYMTDRYGSLNKDEKAIIEKERKSLKIDDKSRVGLQKFLDIIPVFIHLVPTAIKKILSFFNTEDALLRQISQFLDSDHSKFRRQEFTEAYADNFARMYGFGAYLAKAFHKMEKSNNNAIKSRFNKESRRQAFIVSMTKDMINDVHKTDIHRIRALIKEYKDDINDPTIPTKVKKQLKEDLGELEKILDMYLNDFDDFQNKINRMVNDSLEKAENKK